MKTVKRSLLFLCLLAAASLQAQVKLSFNPEKGKMYRYLYQMKQTGKQEVMGQAMNTDVNFHIIYEMEVQEKNAEKIRLNATYRDILFSVSSGMVNINYDSKSPEADSSEPNKVIGAIMGSLLNKTFSLEMLIDGTVTSISGFEEIVQGLADATPENVQMKEMVKQSFNEESMKNIFEQSFRFYPTSAVTIGDSWNNDISFVSFGMNVGLESTYTLQSVEGNVASLGVVSVFQFAPMEGMDGNLTGSQEGAIRLDTKTGMPLHSEMNQKMGGTLSVQGSSITLNTDSKIKVELQEK